MFGVRVFFFFPEMLPMLLVKLERLTQLVREVKVDRQQSCPLARSFLNLSVLFFSPHGAQLCLSCVSNIRI